MTGYYDLVLGLIPLSLAGTTSALLGVGVELTTAVQIGSLIAVALIGHALFVNGPVEIPSQQSSQDSSLQSAD
jgi:hypothetical protein